MPASLDIYEPDTTLPSTARSIKAWWVGFFGGAAETWVHGRQNNHHGTILGGAFLFNYFYSGLRLGLF